MDTKSGPAVRGWIRQKGKNMTYENFKEMVTEELKNLYTEENGFRIEVGEVQKTNQRLEAVYVMRRDNPKFNVGLNVYLGNYYNEYLGNNNFHITMEKIKKFIEFGLQNMDEGCTRAWEIIQDKKAVSERLFFELVNTEKNHELLEEVPHREFLDLSMVYRIALDVGNDSCSSVLIKNLHAEALVFTEQELYELAMKNTVRLFPPVVKDMAEILTELNHEMGCSDESFDECVFKNPMWVITNKYKKKGAGNLVYEQTLYDLAQRLDADLYLMPSSIHEVLAVRVDGNDPKILLELVKEVNATEVSEDEWLSDNIYRYDRMERKIYLIESI